MQLDFNGVEENAFETENRIFKSRPVLFKKGSPQPKETFPRDLTAP